MSSDRAAAPTEAVAEVAAVAAVARCRFEAHSSAEYAHLVTTIVTPPGTSRVGRAVSPHAAVAAAAAAGHIASECRHGLWAAMDTVRQSTAIRVPGCRALERIDIGLMPQSGIVCPARVDVLSAEEAKR